MQVRRLTGEDAATYRELRLRALREHPEAFFSDVEDEEGLTLADWAARFRPEGPAATYGAFDGDRLVGVVTTIRDARRKTRHKATIAGMYVAAESRGHGIGRALLEHALAQLRAANGVELAQLCVVVGNTAARALYVSAGFVPYGIERSAAKLGGRYLDDEYMALRLRPR